MSEAVATLLLSSPALFLAGLGLRIWREAAEAAGARPPRPPRQARRRGRRNDHA